MERGIQVYDERHFSNDNDEARQKRAALGKLDDKADNQGENGERVCNRDANEHRRLNLARGFGIAADGLQCATDENTETDTGADDAETDGNRHSECFCYFNIHNE